MAICRECNKSFWMDAENCCPYCGWYVHYTCAECSYEIYPNESEICETCRWFKCPKCDACKCGGREKTDPGLVKIIGLKCHFCGEDAPNLWACEIGKKVYCDKKICKEKQMQSHGRFDCAHRKIKETVKGNELR